MQTHAYIQQTHAPNSDHPSLPITLESFEEQPGQQQNGQDTSCAKPEYSQDQKQTEAVHVFPSQMVRHTTGTSYKVKVGENDTAFTLSLIH